MISATERFKPKMSILYRKYSGTIFILTDLGLHRAHSRVAGHVIANYDTYSTQKLY